ncbi:MAG TPA: response regulator transcription factor [Candidatus Hydrogenedentes bacterium]|nr:response regulator transcription factor [Candidatus Hydrogenedentota bacterium]
MARILIVDDDPDVVEALNLLLKEQGHETAEAYNRKEGMQAVASFAPDLIILDVMMEQPDDGLTMAQELRRNDFTKPILMLTTVSKATGLDIGKDDEMVPVDDFQEKPISPALLKTKVAELLKKAEG